MTRRNMEPLRISGLPGIMDDAVKFKYIRGAASVGRTRIDGNRPHAGRRR